MLLTVVQETAQGVSVFAQPRRTWQDFADVATSTGSILWSSTSTKYAPLMAGRSSKTSYCNSVSFFPIDCLAIIRFKIKTHRAIEDRLSAAEILQSLDNFSLPLMVDTMKNEANLNYGGLPERMCVVLDGEVKYIGGIGPYNFNIEEMITYLGKIVNCSY
ncbi:unnamed protein product [Clavelina lepadiformis]|uniref:Iodothyronine deiodinase n=1 Tax=Clavelina lepadiformis TaxID=159417 RepID=A0ABP0GIE3_CLALP